jgi:hypothetical protein
MESDIADLERCRADPVEYRAELRRRIGDAAYSRGQTQVRAIVRMLRRENRSGSRRLPTSSRQRRSRRVARRCSSRAGPKSDSDPSPSDRRGRRFSATDTGFGHLAYLTRALRVGATWAAELAYLQHYLLPCWGWAW